MPIAVFEQVLADGGGAAAPRELSARLRALLSDELERGERELGLPRTGYGDPIVAAALSSHEGRVLAAMPVPAQLRADPGAVAERAGALAALIVEKLVEAAAPGAPTTADELSIQAGSLEGSLVLSYPATRAADAAEYAAGAADERLHSMDRLRARPLVVPPHLLEPAGDFREPIGATHPLRVAEAVARLGASPLDEAAVEELSPRLEELLEPAGAVARAHEDSDPVRRTARRILQRLDGMGKWGGYHTAFDHLARGFAGNDRALAYAIGEALLAAGLLGEKTSVGQRHVFLNPRRSGDIRRLIDAGEVPSGLRLPTTG